MAGKPLHQAKRCATLMIEPEGKRSCLSGGIGHYLKAFFRWHSLVLSGVKVGRGQGVRATVIPRDMILFLQTIPGRRIVTGVKTRLHILPGLGPTYFVKNVQRLANDNRPFRKRSEPF